MDIKDIKVIVKDLKRYVHDRMPRAMILSKLAELEKAIESMEKLEVVPQKTKAKSEAKKGRRKE